MTQLADLGKIDSVIEPVLRAARIPGAAIAVVAGNDTIFAGGYGYRDLAGKLPVTPSTVYPIGSTTKAINATLLAMLVEEDKLDWDSPVQEYLPQFRLQDTFTSTQVTLRDLVTMRTGLPRHDWVRFEQPITRAELVMRLRHLPLAASFRERFQYNNLTVTAAGHVAEVVTGQTWETLITQRILEPLGMRSTWFDLPAMSDVTLSYHENVRRELCVTKRLLCEVAAPAGGAIHSTITDMARWLSFNLTGGRSGQPALLSPRALQELHTPQVAVSGDPAAPSPDAAYALGWFVNTYNGCGRVSHGGYLHNVHSEAMFFPDQRIGIIAFTNFGCPTLAGFICEQVFDALLERTPVQRLDERLALYEQKIAEVQRRNASVRRVASTAPSHPLGDYAGVYEHPAYGELDIQLHGSELTLRRNRLHLQLQHWHYDVWVAEDRELFVIHQPHPFDRANRLRFEMDADGNIVALLVSFEPTVAPICFRKRAALPPMRS